MNPFLSPIEKPRGLMKKLAYYFTRKQFGKVLTPVKVHAARLPAAFGLLGLAGVLFSFKGLDAYYIRRSEKT